MPWWQELTRRRGSDQVALEAKVEFLQKWMTTGTLATPGVVWMPPILIQ
jgi:hypothetical protein